MEVLNNYFVTGRWKNALIIPLPETQQMLKQYELGIRQIDNELLLIAKTDSSGKLYHEISPYQKFSFYILPQTPGYINFTNFPFSKLQTPLFYFHNLNNNAFAAKQYLTRSIADYSPARTYEPGDFAKSLVDGKIYEAIRINNAGAGSIAPDNSQAEPALPPDPEAKRYSANFWALMGDGQFAGTGDTQIDYRGTTYTWEACGRVYNMLCSVKKKSFQINVYGLNPGSLQYTRQVYTNTLSSDEDTDQVQVDLRALPSGAYRIQVNDDIRFVWLDTGGNKGAAGMYLDIFNLPAANPQAIVDAGGKPTRIRYTIAFSARRVYWQYKTRTAGIDKIEDNDGKYLFKSNGIRKFISLRPIPFSDQAMKSLIAKGGGLTITSPLPNPQADKLAGQVNGIYSTESFINF